MLCCHWCASPNKKQGMYWSNTGSACRPATGGSVNSTHTHICSNNRVEMAICLAGWERGRCAQDRCQPFVCTSSLYAGNTAAPHFLTGCIFLVLENRSTCRRRHTHSGVYPGHSNCDGMRTYREKGMALPAAKWPTSRSAACWQATAPSTTDWLHPPPPILHMPVGACACQGTWGVGRSSIPPVVLLLLSSSHCCCQQHKVLGSSGGGPPSLRRIRSQVLLQRDH